MLINLDWDPNALAAPQSFRNGVQAAANELDTAIANPITVNIQVGYGEYDDGGPDAMPLTDDSVGGILTAIPVSYPALTAALAANATSSAATQALNVLPDTASLDGQSVFVVATAEAKAFGALPAAAPIVDGDIGFPTSFSGAGLTDVAVTEILHAMGLLNDGGPLGLVAYSSPGVHFLSDDGTQATAYFSLDGGQTDLANYAVGFDDTLFTGQPADPLDFPATGSALTGLDVEELSALGFDDTAAPVAATAPAFAALSAAGTATSVALQSASVAEGASIPVASLVQSVSVPAGGAVSGFAFYDTGNGTGHLSLGGVAEPDGQWVYVLSNQLGTLQYVGGTAAGSETIRVAANSDQPSTVQVGAVSVTTAATGGQAGSGASPSGAAAPSASAPDPGTVALNAAAVYDFANAGVPSFTAVVNQDGSADLAQQAAGGLTPSFIGGYVAGIEIRAIGNTEQAGGSTAQLDTKLGHDLDTLSALLTPGGVAAGFGFLAGLTTGGPTGLLAAGLQSDVGAALGTDQQATAALGGCIVGAVSFAQGYVGAVGGGQGPIAALHGVESAALA